MNHCEIDMTHGSLWKKIFFFSIPLMFSNLLQIVFNMSDVAVVGKFAGPLALGAVGSTSILITLFTGILIGLASGVNSLTALYIGYRRDRSVEETVHTSFLLCLATGILLTVLGIAFSRPVLTLLHTKPELIDGALIYLRIYLLGMPALALFNFGNSVLSAAGDTKHPLLYLTLAGIVNVLLNLFFVIACHMNVAGVAIASIIAQYISAALVIALLMRSSQNFALRLSCLRITPEKMAKILQIGLPSALQFVMFAVANLFVQFSINSFDHVMVEGNSAAANADPLLYDIMAAIYTACASFIAQNLGAGNKQRILKTFRICLLYSFLTGLILGGGIYILRYPFLSLFTSEAVVAEAGIKRLSCLALAYCLSSVMDCTMAAARGLGKTIVPTIILIGGTVFFRILWIFTVFAHFRTIESLYILYAFSWVISGIAELAYFIWLIRHGAADPQENRT